MAKNNKKNYGGAIGKSLLYNRGILYFIFILALGYLFFLSSIYDFYSLSIFVMVGFLTTFFSKNMIVILSLAMSVSFIFKFGTKIRHEGFESEDSENNESSESSDSNESNDNDNESNEDEMKKKMEDLKKSIKNMKKEDTTTKEDMKSKPSKSDKAEIMKKILSKRDE